MLKIPTIASDQPKLQNHDWPIAPDFITMDSQFTDFLVLDSAGKEQRLAWLDSDGDAGLFLHDTLGTIYAYIYGYRDGPLYLTQDAEIEAGLMSAKFHLEHYLLHEWLTAASFDRPSSYDRFLDAIEALSKSNAGVRHDLYDYIEHEASRDALLEFLRLEVCRNEVVDDEVAFLIVGLQGAMKKVMASNLWDECGNGRLDSFHTYWLRRLVAAVGSVEAFRSYRERSQPWFSKITSNTFNAMLTRPSRKYQAYGSFLITEAWVESHFEQLIKGLERVGLASDDILIYFDAHVRIDPHHTKEIMEALRHQIPQLTQDEQCEVLRGGLSAVAAATAQYDHMLQHLRRVDAGLRADGSGGGSAPSLGNGVEERPSVCV